jgi:hypothetical protein
MTVNYKSNLPFAIFNFDAKIYILLILTFLIKNCKTTISFPNGPHESESHITVG